MSTNTYSKYQSLFDTLIKTTTKSFYESRLITVSAIQVERILIRKLILDILRQIPMILIN